MGVGGNTFYRKRTSIHFKVQNITHLLPAQDQKKYYVFNAVIYPGQVLDLLSMSGISEADIRESLIKGELANRIRNKDLIVVSSSIDLLQFDEEQRDFLAAAGITAAIDPKKIAVDTGTPYLELGPLGESVPPNSLFFDVDGTPSYTDENGDPHALATGGGGGGAPTSATYVTLSSDLGLSNERVLTQGAGISITDNGPGSSVVIANTYVPADASTSAKGVLQLGGDLGGTSTSQSVLKVNGVSVTGTPSNGKILTASSSSAASWQDPIVSGAPTNAQYLTLATDGYLTNERVLTEGTNISFVDGGPGGTLTINNAYSYTPTDASTGAKGVVQLSGDLGGTSTSPSVLKVNGVSVTGIVGSAKTLVGTSANSAAWGSLNLADSATFFGILPRGNQQAQTMAGDVTGTTAASVVSKVNGVTVTGTPNNGQVLTATSATAASWQDSSGGSAPADATTSTKGIVQLAGDIAGLADSITVVGLRGRPISSSTPQTNQVLTWNGFSWEPADSSGGSSGAPTSATYLTLSTDATLTNERVLTEGTGIQFVDGGPGGSLTINSTVSAPNATSGTPGLVQLSGDLSGTYNSVTVARLNGATVGAAGALTTGNVLQVSGTSALSYGALNLAGGANYVTGVLPGGNLADASTTVKGAIILAGDLAGTASSPTVAKINGNTVTGTAAQYQPLVGTGAGTVAFGALNLAQAAAVTGLLPSANMTSASTSVTGIVRLTTDLAGTATAPIVVAMTGATGVATIKCATVTNTSQTNVVQRNVVTAIVQTTNATPTTQATIATTNNTLVQIDVLILGNKSDDTQGASYKRSVLIRNVAGTLSIVGAVTDNGTMEDDTTWDATLLVSGANVLVQVTGKAATTINWTSIYSVFQVT